MSRRHRRPRADLQGSRQTETDPRAEAEHETRFKNWEAASRKQNGCDYPIAAASDRSHPERSDGCHGMAGTQHARFHQREWEENGLASEIEQTAGWATCLSDPIIQTFCFAALGLFYACY